MGCDKNMKHAIKLFGIGAAVLCIIGAIHPMIINTRADIRLAPTSQSTTQPTTQPVDPNERIRQIQQELEILRYQLQDFDSLLQTLLLIKNPSASILIQIAFLQYEILHIQAEIQNLENELSGLQGTSVPPTTPSEPPFPTQWDLV
jgi:hypothetical protein